MDAITNIFGQQQQAKQGAEVVRRNKADEALRQQQQDQARAIADRAWEQEERKMDIESDQLKLMKQSELEKALPNLSDAISKKLITPEQGQSLVEMRLRAMGGGTGSSTSTPMVPMNNTPAPQPQATPLTPYRPQPNQSPTGATAPPVAQQPQSSLSTFPDPNAALQAEVNRTRALAGAQAGATAAAEEPYKIAADKRVSADQEKRDARLNDYQVAREGTQNQLQKDLLNTKQIFEAGESAKDRNAAMDRAKLSSGTETSIANINNKTNVMRIGAEYGVDPSTSFNIGQDIYGGGGEKKDDKNPIMRRIAAPWEEQGYKDPGTDIDEFKKLDSIQKQDLPAFSDFAQNVLTGGVTGTKAQQWLAKAGYPSDAAKAEDMLKTRFQSVGKGLEGYNGSRQLASQFSAESSSMPNLSDKQSQGIAKVQNMDNMINGRKAQIIKQYPPQQRELFQSRNPGTDFNIKMKTPKGDIVSIPPAKLEEAIAQGGKVVQ